MRHFKSLMQPTQKEINVSKHLGVTHLLDPTIFVSQAGQLGTTIKIKGIPFDTATNQTLNHAHHNLHQALLTLDERFAVVVTTHRHEVAAKLKGDFNIPFCAQVNQDYFAPLHAKKLYVNDLYLTLVYCGFTQGAWGKGIKSWKRISKHALKSAHQQAQVTEAEALRLSRQSLCAILKPFGPTVLGSSTPPDSQSELLTFLSLVVNGGERNMFWLPLTAPPIGSSLQDAEKQFEKYHPFGHLGAYLPRKRLYFGDGIQFQGNTQDDKRFAVIMGIKNYPNMSGTHPLILDPLLQMDCEFICTHGFAIIGKEQAETTMVRQIRQMENVNDPAISQMEALTEARDQVASNQVMLGLHHHTLMLLSPTQSELTDHIKQATGCYGAARITALRETLGEEPAFWSQVPTNLKFAPRSARITSQNFADFAPLHNNHSGYVDGNHLGSAATMFMSPAKTPVFFNFHLPGSKDNFSPGHTWIFGATTSGKTVLMSFLDSQMNRYHGRSFIFDYRQGMEIYVRACGGQVMNLEPNATDEPTFNPLQLPDSKSNQQFCLQWLCQLVKNDDEDNVPSHISQALLKCVHYNYTVLRPEHRRLSEIAKLLPVDFERHDNLRQWLRANEKHAEGTYAYLFDNPTDDFTLIDKMSFDITALKKLKKPHVLNAVIMYIIYRIEASLTEEGRLTTIWMDEAWSVLECPYFSSQLQEWFATLRKNNCHLVMATQFPDTVSDLPVGKQLVGNSQTKIFYGNQNASLKTYQGDFGLTEAEYECVKTTTTDNRIFLYKQGTDSMLCRLNLSHMPHALQVFSGNRKLVSIVRKIIKDVGDDPNDWLPLYYRYLDNQHKLNSKGESHHD